MGEFDPVRVLIEYMAKNPGDEPELFRPPFYETVLRSTLLQLVAALDQRNPRTPQKRIFCS
jgi:hypothetical protein